MIFQCFIITKNESKWKGENDEKYGNNNNFIKEKPGYL